MATSTAKKKKFTRKEAKRYELVRFQLDFIDGEFEIPSFKQVPGGVQRKVATDVNDLYEFLRAHSTDGDDVIEILDDLDQDETATFLDTWARVSGVELGK
jgi:hypothetical protein